MQRRKLLTAMGSLAAGGAAAMGTGAFTSVSANRSVDVEVADDADALLSIDTIPGAANAEYVDTSGETVSIDLTETNVAGNTGLNANATTKIKDLLRIKNQGTQNVYVWISGDPDGVRFAVQGSSQIQNAGTGAGENQGALSTSSNLDPNDLDDDQGTGKEEAAPELAPGDYIDVEVFSYGDNASLDFDGTVTVQAKDVDKVD
jgi:hypothetical protein